MLLAGGSYFDVFPLRGLTGDDWASLSWFGRSAFYAPYAALALVASIAAGQMGLNRAPPRNRNAEGRAYGTWALGGLLAAAVAIALVSGDLFGDNRQHIWLVLLPAAWGILTTVRRIRRKDRTEISPRTARRFGRLLAMSLWGVAAGITAIGFCSVVGLVQAVPAGGVRGEGMGTLFGRVGDYAWHIFLPVFASSIGAFATLTLLTKNSFLDEIKKQYVMTARAKGLTERRVMYGHVFRNAMLIVISGFPALFIGVFFGGSLIIETLFSLDGLGRLGFEAAVARDYPVVFGTLFAFSLIGLVVGIITDLTYVIIDPRIDFESRG